MLISCRTLFATNATWAFSNVVGKGYLDDDYGDDDEGRAVTTLIMTTAMMNEHEYDNTFQYAKLRTGLIIRHIQIDFY